MLLISSTNTYYVIIYKFKYFEFIYGILRNFDVFSDICRIRKCIPLGGVMSKFSYATVIN